MVSGLPYIEVVKDSFHNFEGAFMLIQDREATTRGLRTRKGDLG